MQVAASGVKWKKLAMTLPPIINLALLNITRPRQEREGVVAFGGNGVLAMVYSWGLVFWSGQ